MTRTNYTPIQEGSQATPGLWNAIFSALSTDLDVVLSATTSTFSSSVTVTGGMTLVGPLSVQSGPIRITTNSNVSDYLYFTDSSNARSSYVIGSFNTKTADGLNIWDDSGQTMLASFSKQSIRFFQNVVGPVFDVGGALAGTYNAGTFGTGTDSKESRIQAAINAASLAAIPRVYLPASLYPYSASSVSFIDTVQMVREGGNWDVFDVRAYGAAGDGTNDSTAILATVNAATSATVGALTNRAVVYFPTGVYTITTSAPLTQTKTTSVRAGIHYQGVGMNTSILRLAPSGSDLYFYNNVATPRLQGCSFADLGFEGMNPANFNVFTDIPVNAKGFRLWATTATGSHEQNFYFTRCRFMGLASVYETAGDNTTSENIFVQCKFTQIRTQFALINNLQSNDHEFFGCQWADIYGDVFVVDANGGGAIKVIGGSCIMQSQTGGGALTTYFFKQLGGAPSGEVGDPFYFDGVKMEILGDKANLVNIGVVGRVVLNFEKCSIHDTSTVDKVSWVTIKQQSSIFFRRCSFVETAEHIKFLVNTTVTAYGINGEIIFDACELAPDWSDKCTIAVTGSIRAINCFGNNVGAQTAGVHHAHDFELRNGSVLGQVAVWDGTGTVSDSASPTHPQWHLKTAELKQEQESWPISVPTEHTLKLPKGAYIKAIHIRKPIRAADGTSVNLTVTNGDKTVTHLTTNTAAWGPNTHTGDVDNYYYCVGDTVNARTLRLANSGAPAQTIYGGLAIVEYY